MRNLVINHQPTRIQYANDTVELACIFLISSSLKLIMVLFGEICAKRVKTRGSKVVDINSIQHLK